jgi:type IV pilus assembly protein PilM
MRYTFYMSLTRTLARWFPVPHTLAPCGTGVDISDASVKWLSVARSKQGFRVASYGSEKIPEGVVQSGAIKNPEQLATVLKEVKKKTGIVCAHAALPEEGAYVFSMHVPQSSSRAQIMNMIEFELESRVPIPPAQAVYDFDTVSHDEQGEEISVTVFPRDLADGYVEAFSRAGIELVSLEIEARSVARAVSGVGNDPVTLLVDCGKDRTGVAILKKGIPIFTSTVDIGGALISKAAIDALSLKTEEEAEKFKNEHGLVADDPALQKGYEAVERVAASLAEEIARHYRFWDTRRGEHGERASVERVYLVGGSANLKGLPEYVAGKVHAHTERPNVWRNLFSFDDYLPEIEYRASFQYATAIGLAMRSI